VAILIVLGAVFLISYYILFYNFYRMNRYSKRAIKKLKEDVQRHNQATPSVEQCRQLWESIWQRWKEEVPTTSKILAGSLNKSDDEIVEYMAHRAALSPTNKPPEELETGRLVDLLLTEFRRLVSRVLMHKGTLFFVLFLTVIGLTVMIPQQSQRVAEGHPLDPALSTLTGLRADRVTISTLSTDIDLPSEVTAGPVLYLGESDGTAVILIPGGGGTAIRLPSTEIVIRSQNH
jgi:ribosomal protein L31E